MARIRFPFPAFDERAPLRLALAVAVSAVLVVTVVTPVQADVAQPVVVAEPSDELLPPISSPEIVAEELEFPEGDFSHEPEDVHQEKDPLVPPVEPDTDLPPLDFEEIAEGDPGPASPTTNAAAPGQPSMVTGAKSAPPTPPTG